MAPVSLFHDATRWLRASDEVAETGLKGEARCGLGYHEMKKGKKMPSIELEGESEATFALVNGKIVRVENQPRIPMQPPGGFEPRLRGE